MTFSQNLVSFLLDTLVQPRRMRSETLSASRTSTLIAHMSNSLTPSPSASPAFPFMPTRNLLPRIHQSCGSAYSPHVMPSRNCPHHFKSTLTSSAHHSRMMTAASCIQRPRRHCHGPYVVTVMGATSPSSCCPSQQGCNISILSCSRSLNIPGV